MKILLLKYLLCLVVALAGIQMQTSHAIVYIVTNTAANTPANTPGGMRFTDAMGDKDTVKALMDSAKNFIWTTFQQYNENQLMQLVTLSVEETADHSVIGYTLFTPYANGMNTYDIHFDAPYIQDFSGDVQTEIKAVLYHEMTHMWQWTGNGNINLGLYEGIADYVTLKAGYKRSYWGEPGQGQNWDDGFEVTAYFLDYCNGLPLLEGLNFVAELNKMMKDDYDVNYFYVLLGYTVEELWAYYKSAYNNNV